MGQISQLIIAATSGHVAFNCQPSQPPDTASHVHEEEEKRLVLQYFTNTKANSHNFVFFSAHPTCFVAIAISFPCSEVTQFRNRLLIYHQSVFLCNPITMFLGHALICGTPSKSD